MKMFSFGLLLSWLRLITLSFSLSYSNDCFWKIKNKSNSFLLNLTVLNGTNYTYNEYSFSICSNKVIVNHTNDNSSNNDHYMVIRDHNVPLAKYNYSILSILRYKLVKTTKKKKKMKKKC